MLPIFYQQCGCSTISGKVEVMWRMRNASLLNFEQIKSIENWGRIDIDSDSDHLADRIYSYVAVEYLTEHLIRIIDFLLLHKKLDALDSIHILAEGWSNKSLESFIGYLDAHGISSELFMC